MKRNRKMRKMRKITSCIYGRKDVYFVDMDDEVFIRWKNEEDDEVGELWCQYYDTDGWLQEYFLGPASSFRERRIYARV